MNKKYTIRPEQVKDYDSIYTLIQTAFLTAKEADGNEQDFAASLRSTSNYIPELSLVVEDGEKLIAHIMLTQIILNTPNGPHKALMLAPISVLLEYRDQGVGSKLIRESLLIARSMGYDIVMLCGDPGYYNRFGFKTASSFGICNTDGIPDQYVLACELEANVLDKVTGTFSFF